MIAAAARAFTTKLNEMTPRERSGLAALFAIGALTGVVYALDWANTSGRSAEIATQHAANAAALRASYQDDGYRQQLASGAGRVWRWSRTSDTFVGEEISAELEALCLQSGFSEPRVTLIEAPPPQGRVGSLELSVSAMFDWANFLALLEEFESSDLSFTIRSIDVGEEDGTQVLSFVVAVPVITAEASP